MLFVLWIVGGEAAAQKTASPSVTIRGKLIAKHPDLNVSGMRYYSWQRVEHQDTAVTDATGAFTLRLTVPRAWSKDIGRGQEVPLSLHQHEDSASFSAVKRIYLSSLPLDTAITIELYPRVVLGDGTLPKNFRAPRFPSGDVRQFFAEKLNYPEEAREAGISGVVVVRFWVDEDGALSAPQIVRGVGGGCSEEVLRVVSKMPVWIPGEVAGKQTAMMYYMPVSFTLE